MTDRFYRHGDVMTHVAIIDDPVYLSEPLVKTNGFTLLANGTMDPYPCSSVVEVVNEDGHVPHYLPGTNTDMLEFGQAVGLPVKATRGGAQTALPEFQEELK